MPFALHESLFYEPPNSQSVRLRLTSCEVRVSRLSPAETPEGKAQATVGVQADGDLSRRVQLTLQLNRATQGTGGSMGHLRQTHGVRNVSPTF